MKLILDTPQDSVTKQAVDYHIEAFILRLEDNKAVLKFLKKDADGDNLGGGRIIIDGSQLDNLLNNSTSYSDMISRIYTKLQNKYPGTIS